MAKPTNNSESVDLTEISSITPAKEFEPNKGEALHTIKKTGTLVELVKQEKELINCLRNEKVKVRFVFQDFPLARDKDHVFYGGKAETAVDYLTTPQQRNGSLVNVLTNEEKDFLEHVMGLPVDSLSVYKKTDNYWHNIRVPLVGKGETILDLSNPEEYIQYKVLLANKMLVCPNVESLRTNPKQTYRYVLVSEKEVVASDTNRMNTSIEATIRFGELKNDYDKLRFIVEILSGKPLAPSTKLDFIQTKAYDLLTDNPKAFLRVASDPHLDDKVLLRMCVDAGIVRRRENYYYLNNQPLCNDTAEPTLDVAAKYISLAVNQELKLGLQARLKASRD